MLYCVFGQWLNPELVTCVQDTKTGSRAWFDGDISLQFVQKADQVAREINDMIEKDTQERK